jgi:dTMP kinase
LEQDQIVILDRYIISTMAYQGLNFEIEDLYGLNENFLRPDITFFIDIDPEIGLKRKEGEKELFEKLDLQKKIRDNYFKSIDLLKTKNWPIVYLDGSKEVDFIHQEILNSLAP